MARLHSLRFTVPCLAGLVLFAACSSDDEAARRGSVDGPGAPAEADAGVEPADFPFEPTPPHAYVAKVKNLLTGLPPTADELATVVKDPGALKGMIDGWVASAEGQSKLMTFLALAFQQTQFLAADFNEAIKGDDVPGAAGPQGLLIANMKESIARTALALIAQGRPFTETVTTKTFMMTPALMAFYGYFDYRRINDKNSLADKWVDYANSSFRLQNTQPVPIEQSVDPSSPNYMNWYTASSLGTGCTSRTYQPPTVRLANVLFGRATSTGNCPDANTVNIVPIVTPADFTTWKMVTVRAPNPGEATTRFFDLPKLRSTNELVLGVPRVGFFTTPAFLAGWRTNTSNDARVMINQTLIVSTGQSFEPEAAFVPISETGLDTQHITPGTTCYGCHISLDPMRNYFRKNLTIYSHEQLDATERAKPASFTFGGVTATGNTLEDLAATLAAHPRFGIAWAQKLCFYADSAKCSEDDPELLRVVKAFEDSRFDLRVLLRELMSSPLVTGAARTKTFKDREVVVSVARYDHLCRALANRLGVDACNLDATARLLADNLPRDGYSRGGEDPVLNSDVSLFYRTTTENLCRVVADAVVEPAAGNGRYASADEKGAILDFVKTVMALPEGDPRHAGALVILQEHAAAAKQTGAKPVDALKSTFILACTAPSAVSVGL